MTELRELWLANLGEDLSTNARPTKGLRSANSSSDYLGILAGFLGPNKTSPPAIFLRLVSADGSHWGYVGEKFGSQNPG